MPTSSDHQPIARRRFGRYPDLVSIIGLGGYHLGKPKTMTESVRIMHAAFDAGVNFLDNAWEYHDGESEKRMGRAIEDRRDAVFLMTKVCTHGRDAHVAMRQLEQSLRRLRTDHLDLWQVHECVYYNDPERHFEPGGVIEALDRAKQQGKVRYVGFTGHKDPDILLKMLSFDYPFDSCQLPLNVYDAHFRSFQKRVLPELLRRQIAPIGMKSLGDGRAIQKKRTGVDSALRYAMSLPVCTTVSGIDSMKVLRQNLKIARAFSPTLRPFESLRVVPSKVEGRQAQGRPERSRGAMTDQERATYERTVAHDALDGRYELYKTTAEHDGEEGREQHGFPSQEELGG